MKFKEEIDQELQDKEVARWWNHPRNIRWDNFYYSHKKNKLVHSQLIIMSQNIASIFYSFHFFLPFLFRR